MANKKGKKPNTPGSSKMKDVKKERFCYLYASGHSHDHFGNASRSYSSAFGYEEKLSKLEEDLVTIAYNKETDRKKKRQEIVRMQNVIKSCGNRLLTYADIIDRVNYFTSLLNSDDTADNELAFVMKQRKDLQSKTAAIREFNRVKNRVSEKVEGELVVRWAKPGELEGE